MALGSPDPLKNPMDLPIEFKSWLGKYLELNPPNLPVNQMLGYKDGPRITSGLISDGPPASPSDGDIWIATGVDANGTVWQFRYNASSSSAYKWEFIGGSPWIGGRSVSLPMTSMGASSDVSGWFFDTSQQTWYTTSREGDYIAHVSADLFANGVSSQSQIAYAFNGSNVSWGRVDVHLDATVNFEGNSTFARLPGVLSGRVIYPIFSSNNISTVVEQVSVWVQPIRIS